MFTDEFSHLDLKQFIFKDQQQLDNPTIARTKIDIVRPMTAQQQNMRSQNQMNNVEFYKKFLNKNTSNANTQQKCRSLSPTLQSNKQQNYFRFQQVNKKSNDKQAYLGAFSNCNSLETLKNLAKQGFIDQSEVNQLIKSSINYKSNSAKNSPISKTKQSPNKQNINFKTENKQYQPTDQKQLSIEKYSQNKSSDIVKQNSLNQLEKNYTNAIKIIDNHDNNNNKLINLKYAKQAQLEFNNQFFELYQKLGRLQLKPVMSISDNSSQHFQLLGFDFVQLKFSANKNKLYNLTIDLKLHHGEIEMFISKQPRPNWDNYDFYFNIFVFKHDIKYDHSQTLDFIYINIFCIQSCDFTIRCQTMQKFSDELPAPTNTEKLMKLLQKQQEKDKKHQQQLYEKQQLMVKIVYLNKNTKQQIFQQNQKFLSNSKDKDNDDKNDGAGSDNEQQQLKMQKKKNFILKNQKLIRNYSPELRKVEIETKKNLHQQHSATRRLQATLIQQQQLDDTILKVFRRNELKKEAENYERQHVELSILKKEFIFQWRTIMAAILLNHTINIVKTQIRNKLDRFDYLMSRLGQYINICKRNLQQRGSTQLERVLFDSKAYFQISCKHKHNITKKRMAKVLSNFLKLTGNIYQLEKKVIHFLNLVRSVQSSYRSNQLQRKQILIKLDNYYDFSVKEICNEEHYYYSHSWVTKKLFMPMKNKLILHKNSIITNYLKKQVKIYLDGMKGYVYRSSKLKRVQKIAYLFLQYICNILIKKEQDDIISQCYIEKKEIHPVDYYLKRLQIIIPFGYYKIDKNPFDLLQGKNFNSEKRGSSKKSTNEQIMENQDQSQQMANSQQQIRRKFRLNTIKKKSQLIQIVSNQKIDNNYNNEPIDSDINIDNQQEIFNDYFNRPFIYYYPTLEEMKLIVITEGPKYFK